MLTLKITIEETDSGLSCGIEGTPNTGDKKTTEREFVFGKGVSDLVGANSKFIARLAELETGSQNFGRRIASIFKDAAKEVYAVSEEEFNDMVKNSSDMNELREKLEARAKANAEPKHEEKPVPAHAEPCDLAKVEEAVKEELGKLPSSGDEKPADEA